MRKYRGFLSGLLAAALSLSLVTPGLGAENTQPPDEPSLTGPEGMTYADVAADAWYAEAVYYCANHSLMNGISTDEPAFAPEQKMTRATLATVLYRMSGMPLTEGTNPFTDVKRDQWYTNAVLWANDKGLMLGRGNGLFGTNDPVTRQEMAAILWRYAGSYTPKGTGTGYDDEADLPDWAAKAVAWCREKRILYTESARRLGPTVEAARCEIAWALMSYERNAAEPDPWEAFEKVFGYFPEKSEVPANTYIRENFKVLPELSDPSEPPEDGDTPSGPSDPPEDGEDEPTETPALPEPAPAPAVTRFMIYQGAPYTVGIDISSWQKNVDWQAVADAGVQFVMLRVGFRGWGSGAINRDAYFIRNIEGALAAGLDVGLYFFSQAVTIDEAVKEAEYTVKMAQGYNVTYPIVFDWERQSDENSRTKDTSYETIAACAVAFCETVKEAGYIPMYYASPSKAKKMEMGYVADYPFWLAHYTTDQAPTSYRDHFDMWQYSSKWTVPGVKGSVDVNICLTDWSAYKP